MAAFERLRLHIQLRESVFKLWTFWSLCLLLIQLEVVLCGPLYTDKDNILLLNQSTFVDTVYDKDRAFIIEFYNSWCGHCIRYAPTWVEFAGDIKEWKTVVAPAAVDCAQTDNVKICQDYNIPSFPTIKYFWTHATSEDLGEQTGHKDVTTLRHELIDFLDENAKEKGTPKSWPSLQPVSVSRLNDIWLDVPISVQVALLIVETPDSYIGREVILDFSGTRAYILRILNSQTSLLEEIPDSIVTLPSLLLLRRNSKPEILFKGRSRPRIEFQTAIEVVLGFSLNKNPGQNEAKADHRDNGPKPAAQLPVQMVDLETTLHYILTQEVALKKELSGEKLSAFKTFLAALTKSFPGREPVMRFLHYLYDQVSSQNEVINMDDLQHTISEAQSEDAFLPSSSKWIGCKGSQVRYRGYPCGLWTVFHSMTVQSFRGYLAGKVTNPQQVLFAIRNYILQFFSCSDCVKHFQSMSITMEAQAQNPNDTILWLWQAHNRVNLRLKGDATEDPEHPKELFPSPQLCPKCRMLSDSNDLIWDLREVLYFLVKFYGESKISLTDVVEYEPPTTAIPKWQSFNREQKRHINKGNTWNFRYFSGLDISLCVLLYAFSMVLLILVFVIFRLRRRKFKRKCYTLP